MPSTSPVGSRPAEVIGELVAGPLADAGFDLEDVSVRRAGPQSVVAVAVDRDGGVDLDAVAAASRLVSAVLDEPDRVLPGALGSSYTLEVTSRGTDAPLTEPRHWRRAVGRLVEVRRRGHAVVTGRVVGVDAGPASTTVSLEVPAARTAAATVRIELADVTRALVQIEFNPPGGPTEREEIR